MAIVRILDVETTGFEPPAAQVCEVGYCDVDTDTRTVSPEYHSWICGINGPMPPETRAVHHISADDCDGLPPFDPDTVDADNVAVFAAHNAEFEAKFITFHKPSICTYKAALRVWLINPDLTLSRPFHRAGPDAYVTGWILVALLNAGATGKDMVAWTKEPKLLPKCTIGKFRGKPWPEVEDGFLGWMLKQVDMDADLKWNAARELKRRNG